MEPGIGIALITSCIIILEKVSTYGRILDYPYTAIVLFIVIGIDILSL